jgi:phage major head subunit gpT-like protein
MLVNKANLTAVFITLKTTFNKAFDGAPVNWDKVAMLVPSGSSQNDYAWIDRFPKMREWIGDKVIKALKAHQYTVVNKAYEATVSVLRDDIEDDNLGIYAPMAQEAGFSAKTWPDELIADLVNGAFAAECFDGQYFYDTDHSVAGSSVSNKGTAALSVATQAAALSSYGAARAAVMGFTDDDSRPLGLIPNLLQVPPALESVGRILCYADKLVDNSPNPYKGTAELFVDPRLTSSTAWFLHCTNRPVKPFIFQQRKAPVFVEQTNMEADDVFMRGEYKFGVESRGNAGYGLWQTSYGSTGAG